MIVGAGGGEADLAVFKRNGQGPVAALVFAGDEFGVNQLVGIPLGQQRQGVLHAGIHSAEHQVAFPVIHPAVRQRAESAEDGVHTGVAQGVGVLLAVAVRVFIGELVEHFFTFFQGHGHFAVGVTELGQPVCTPEGRVVEVTVAVHAGQAVVLSVVGNVAEALRIIFDQPFIAFRHALLDHFQGQLHGNALLDPLGELRGVLQHEHVRHFAARDTRGQQLVVILTLDEPDVQVHIELFFQPGNDRIALRDGVGIMTGQPRDGDLLVRVGHVFAQVHIGQRAYAADAKDQSQEQGKTFFHGNTSFNLSNQG